MNKYDEFIAEYEKLPTPQYMAEYIATYAGGTPIRNGMTLEWGANHKAALMSRLESDTFTRIRRGSRTKITPDTHSKLILAYMGIRSKLLAKMKKKTS